MNPNANANAATNAQVGAAGTHSTGAIGESLKDGWKMFHGAGEELRGNINAALDGAGDAIAGRERPLPSSGEAVAARGAAEAEQGRMGLERTEAAANAENARRM